MEYARKLRDDRGKCNVLVVDNGHESPEEMDEDSFGVSHTQHCDLDYLTFHIWLKSN